jgi:hypothetical protein
LSQDEFTKLLSRAAERHTRSGSQDFTLPELIDAGAELQIDAETVRAVYAEHEREKDAAEALQAKRAATSAIRRPRPVPAGSRLQVIEEGETLYLLMPPPGSAKFVAGIIPAIAAGIAAFVTTAAPLPLTARLGFDLLVFLIAYLAVQSVRTGQELRLRRDGSGALVRVRGDRGKAIMFQPGQVAARLDEHVSGTQSSVQRRTYVALDHGTDTYELMSNFSRAEQAWAVERIQHWLGHR